jgi:formamidopyrimidine-DNA glycosylase
MDFFPVGYKENQPCPACGETIILIKTGGRLLTYALHAKKYNII